MRRHFTVERFGSLLLIAIALAVLGVVCVSAAFRVAADDLYASIDEARGQRLERPRGQPGMWLSTQLSADLDPANLARRNDRADELSYRSDRLREAAGVGALVGLLVAVLTGRPGAAMDRARDAPSAAANTTSNGTA
jgi:hypothetical protein